MIQIVKIQQSDPFSSEVLYGLPLIYFGNSGGPGGAGDGIEDREERMATKEKREKWGACLGGGGMNKLVIFLYI